MPHAIYLEIPQRFINAAVYRPEIFWGVLQHPLNTTHYLLQGVH